MFTSDFIFTIIRTEQIHFQSFNKLKNNTHFLCKQAIIQLLQLVQKNIQVHFTLNTLHSCLLSHENCIVLMNIKISATIKHL